MSADAPGDARRVPEPSRAAAPLDWLLPRPEPLGPAVRPDDVGPVGWRALLRDGVLRPVWGDLATVTGRTADPSLRASAVRPLVPPRAVLGRAGAVWVHTGGRAPSRFDVLVEPRVRRPAPHPARVPHECPLPAGDVVRLGDVRVTTPLRTALDLVRWLDPAAAGPLVGRLVAHAALDPGCLAAAAAARGDRPLRVRLARVLDAQPWWAGTPERRAPGTPSVREPVMR